MRVHFGTAMSVTASPQRTEDIVYDSVDDMLAKGGDMIAFTELFDVNLEEIIKEKYGDLLGTVQFGRVGWADAALGVVYVRSRIKITNDRLTEGTLEGRRVRDRPILKFKANGIPFSVGHSPLRATGLQAKFLRIIRNNFRVVLFDSNTGHRQVAGDYPLAEVFSSGVMHIVVPLRFLSAVVGITKGARLASKPDHNIVIVDVRRKPRRSRR